MSTTDELHQLAGQAEHQTEHIVSMAEHAAQVPYAAQATHAMLQAATAMEVARAYLEAAEREAAEPTGHDGPPCDTCGARLPFDPPADEGPRCAECSALIDPTGLSIEATRHLEDDQRRHREHLAHLGPAHAQALADAWKAIRP